MTLAEYLEAKQVTVAEMARRIDRAHSTVARIARGEQMPDWATVARIAAATDGAVTANDFMPETAA